MNYLRSRALLTLTTFSVWFVSSRNNCNYRIINQMSRSQHCMLAAMLSKVLEYFFVPSFVCSDDSSRYFCVCRRATLR